MPRYKGIRGESAMEFSRHARKRLRQRGIREECVELIVNYGTPTKKPGNAWEYRLTKKDKRRAIQNIKHQLQLLDKADMKAVIVSEDAGKVVTIYHSTESAFWSE
jgi:hypothetical protein